MADQQQQVQPRRNLAVIFGRIEEVTALDNGGFDTAIAIAADDEFSSPSFVHVYSDKRIGQKGEMVEQLCQVRGFRQRINGNKGVWVKYTNTYRAVQ